ncbi:penicillin-binding protein [Brachybacterium phenoliresistens]|uniref:Penicillin-binding protein n=1 Tax=Brachybacterium phenoliresistens TaxID=396014 RepID=Z9JTP2_9MICO|nr:serine hydrolase domain-containing protein [Brachybacterium phenoliresistens]EWS81534.1 penicillin-binding protein [Brachybacterium phenoliresistens]
MNGSSTTARTPDIDLAPLLSAIEEERLGVRAVHVHRAGTRESEDVVHRRVEDTIEQVYSISKTVTALAVGIARAEGLLDLDDLLVDHLEGISDLPREALGEGVERIRLRHLITMTSGSPVLMFEEAERMDPDPAALYLGTDLVREPGAQFEYSNGGVYMLGRVVAARAGISLRDYLMPRLFEPLGILNPQWFTDRGGSTWAATGLNLRSGEVARIGRLLLDRGRWTGADDVRGVDADAVSPDSDVSDASADASSASADSPQLVPEAWIDALHSDHAWVETGDADPENVQYGFGVWRCTPEGAWRADGAYGQFIVVLPQQEAVITVTSRHEGSPSQEILRALWRHVVPQL